MKISLESLNLAAAEQKLCEEALRSAGSIVEAAALLGITRHALKRRIVKYSIVWPPRRTLGGPSHVDMMGQATAAMQF